jgi:hypothetical protein
MIAQTDDPELLEWLAKANQEGDENYPLLRPVLIQLRAKYPRYEPSAAVKEEIRRT